MWVINLPEEVNIWVKLSYDNTSSKLASTPKNCFVHFLISTFTFSFLPGGLSYSLLSPPASPAIIGGHKEKHLNSHFKTDSDSGWCWHQCRTFAGENNWDCGVKHCCWQRWFNFLKKIIRPTLPWQNIINLFWRRGGGGCPEALRGGGVAKEPVAAHLGGSLSIFGFS